MKMGEFIDEMSFERYERMRVMGTKPINAYEWIMQNDCYGKDAELELEPRSKAQRTIPVFDED